VCADRSAGHPAWKWGEEDSIITGGYGWAPPSRKRVAPLCLAESCVIACLWDSDGHTAILLTAAGWLAQRRQQFLGQ